MSDTNKANGNEAQRSSRLAEFASRWSEPRMQSSFKNKAKPSTRLRRCLRETSAVSPKRS
nr:MAG TPA: hypothetical protein [Caudoviricetes sp.]